MDTFGRYSLINVSREYDGLVDGVWLVDHTGTLESAVQKAKRTEEVNSNRITVAVVEGILVGAPIFSVRTGLKRLG